MPSRFFRITVAYDGTDYRGWQVQPDEPTIQGALQEALSGVLDQSVACVGSGRTDAGVHALGQMASFHAQTHLAADVIRRALNASLPRDIAVHTVDEVPADFHAIRSTICKTYLYKLHDGPVRDVFERRFHWQLRRRIDEQAMSRAARPLVGKHDFRSFENQWPNQATSVRTVQNLTVTRLDPPAEHHIEISIRADGFLYNMVRNIVGTLVEVGQGAQDEEFAARALAAGDRKQAGATAPPHGLHLQSVEFET